MGEHYEGSLILTGEGNPGSAEPKTPEEFLGRHAYDAYVAASGGVSLVSGATLPDWAELGADIRGAWTTAAEAVRREITA